MTTSMPGSDTTIPSVTAAPTAPAAPTLGTTLPRLRMTEAYEATIEEMEAVPDADAMKMFTDMGAVTIRVHAYIPLILTLREELVQLRGFDVQKLDNLERYTLAASHAHGIFSMVSEPSRSLEELQAELAKVRTNLISVAVALENYGFMDASLVKNLRNPNGHQNLAYAVVALVDLFRKNWSAISAKCPIGEPSLLEAEDLATQMLAAIGIKGRVPQTTSAASLTRRKALTLFVRAYDEVRRGVTFLRWYHDDVETFTPSLAPDRKSGRTESKTEELTPDVPNVNAGSTETPPIVNAANIGLPSDEPVGRG